MTPLKYLSVCSGIESATVAWHRLGWEPVAFAEIEDFPNAVLAHHFPHVPNRGDITKDHEHPKLSIDILVGGTPCQGFSIAGLRAGLADPRSHLSLTFLGMAERHRPRWVVWENVPGVHSSWSDVATCDPTEGSRAIIEEARRLGRAAGFDLGSDFSPEQFEEADQSSDFDSFVAGLEKLGYGWAYRVLDAQHFGVPQRRRRVFLVGYLGDWRRAAEVLFEPESLRGDSPPVRGSGERVAGTLTRGALDGSGACGGDGRDGFMISGPLLGERGQRLNDKDGQLIPDVVGALTDGAHGGGGSMAKMRTAEEFLPAVAWALQERDAKGPDSDTKEGHLIPMRRGGSFDDLTPDLADPVSASEQKSYTHEGTGNFRLRNCVGAPIAFSSKDAGGDAELDLSPTLRAANNDASNANSGAPPAIAFDTTQITNPENRSNPQPGGPCHALAAKAHVPAIAIQERAISENVENGPDGVGVRDDDTAFTLEARRQPQAVAFEPRVASGRRAGVIGDTVGALTKEMDRGDGHPCVAFEARLARNGRGAPSEVTPPLKAQSGTSGKGDAAPLMSSGMAVRRLTPKECERLQGFPDNYTRIPYNGRRPYECPDGPRYKALGNSKAVPVVEWIGQRIAKVDATIPR